MRNVVVCRPQSAAAVSLRGRRSSYAGQVETLTFLFTDIEGSTVLLRRVGESAYGQILADHHGVIRSALADHGGRELNTLGDGFFAAFPSPRECAAAVLDMQRALESHAWPGGEHVRVRMGVHTGEAAETAAAGVLGLDVHRAARIAAVAHGGQILLSETAAALIRDSLPAGASLTDLGVHRLKDLGRPEQLYQLSAPDLQTEFPQLASLGHLPNNLPVQLATFIGRRRELQELRALVGSSRLVTLTGAGGCGKTRLSLQVAAELLDGSGDGVWLVELAGVKDEEAVAPAIAAVLGIATPPGRPVLEVLLDALVPQNALIVLDNSEHLIGACAKAADAILRRCPRMYLLATSREPLGIGGEVIYRVPSLSLPETGEADEWVSGDSDAVELFVDRAHEQGVNLSIDAETGPLIASICRRLDGMPLAIELAAARLRSLSLTELRDRLHQRFRLLTGGSRAALERQQTLQATVDWSYSLLGQADKQLLRRLSVFADSFDLAAVEAVCGFGDVDVFGIAELLGSLVDKSLVVPEQSGGSLRYRLLETIRQFAAERLLEAGGEDEVAAVGAAHCAHFLAVAEDAAPHLAGAEQRRWFKLLEADDANLWRAARFAAAEPGGDGLVLRFAAALRRYWQASSEDVPAFELLGPVLERADPAAEPAVFGAALVTAVMCARSVALSAARKLAHRAIDFARELGDERLLVETLSIVCGNYYFSGEPEIGLPLGQEAVERARQLADDGLLGAALMGYLLCKDALDPGHVDALFAEAIACTERAGDKLIGFVLYNNAGVHALRAGDMATARAYLSRAEDDGFVVGERSHHADVNIGWVDRNEGDLDTAQARFTRGLRQSRRNGERAGIAYSSLGLACNEADRGDPLRAAELFGAAQSFLDRAGEAWQEPEATYREAGLAKLRAALGPESADRAYTEGRALGFDDAFDLALGRIQTV